MHESPDNRLISLFFYRPQPTDVFRGVFVPNDDGLMDLITDPVTGVLRVVGVDPLLWFQPQPTVFSRDPWEWSSLPWWSGAVGAPEHTYLEESTPEDRLVRWLYSFQDEVLDWPPFSEKEPPLESQEELEEPGEQEAQPAPRRRRRGRRSGRLVRERRIAALIQRWRPI